MRLHHVNVASGSHALSLSLMSLDLGAVSRETRPSSIHHIKPPILCQPRLLRHWPCSAAEVVLFITDHARKCCCIFDRGSRTRSAVKNSLGYDSIRKHPCFASADKTTFKLCETKHLPSIRTLFVSTRTVFITTSSPWTWQFQNPQAMAISKPDHPLDEAIADNQE